MFIYSYMFKLHHLQSTFDTITYEDIFSMLKRFWTCQFWCFLAFLQFFVLPLPHRQNVSLWGLFSSGETKNIAPGKIWQIGRAGPGVMSFLVKNCWTLTVVWAGMLVNHPQQNEQMCWKILKIHWRWMQPFTTTPAGPLTQMGSGNTHLVGGACTTRDPPSRRPFWISGGPPLYYVLYIYIIYIMLYNICNI